jgi:ATP-dependent Clp protease ATP-binding subunit ClpC
MHTGVATGYLLLGLIQARDGIAIRVLKNLGVDFNELEGAIKQLQGESDNND